MNEVKVITNKNKFITNKKLEPKAFIQWITWAFIFIAAVFFFTTVASKYLLINPQNYGPFWSNRYWLFLHVIGGSTALLSGPFQFLPFIRKNHIKIHRWTGRFYLLGILLGSTGAFYLAINSVVGWMFGTALFVLGITWLTCPILGLICIRRRQIEAHQLWMTRSYILTFAFLIFRVLSSAPLLTDVELHYRFSILIWFSWLPTLFGYEFVRQIQVLKKNDLNQ